jgi:hypothetical protein
MYKQYAISQQNANKILNENQTALAEFLAVPLSLCPHINISAQLSENKKQFTLLILIGLVFTINNNNNNNRNKQQTTNIMYCIDVARY